MFIYSFKSSFPLFLDHKFSPGFTLRLSLNKTYHTESAKDLKFERSKAELGCRLQTPSYSRNCDRDHLWYQLIEDLALFSILVMYRSINVMRIGKVSDYCCLCIHYNIRNKTPWCHVSCQQSCTPEWLSSEKSRWLSWK